MQELQARVEAQHPRDHGEPEVVGQRAHDVGPDDVGRADERHVDVGAPAREAAHVALDLVDVLGVAGGGQALGPHVLGEHRGVARARAVDRGRRLHDQALHRRRLLARSEELHGADDVELLHRPATTGRAGRGDHAHVDDGVDVLLGEDLGDDGVADVGADEGDVPDVAARGDDVHPDDSLDGRVAGRGARESSSDVPGDPGDQHDPSHVRGCYLPSLRRWTRVFLSNLRCFFLAMRLRRFLMTEPTWIRPFLAADTCRPDPPTLLGRGGQRGIASDPWIRRGQPAL